MKTRSIAIGLIAVLAAFGVAFGAGKATSKTPDADPGVSAEVIEVAAPAAIAGVKVGGSMPALKSAAKKKAKKASAPKKSSGSSTASKPSTSNNTPSTPVPSKSAPTAPAPSAPKPAAPAAPKPAAPKPQPAPVTGGGDEG